LKSRAEVRNNTNTNFIYKIWLIPKTIYSIIGINPGRKVTPTKARLTSKLKDP
jgi:hypothetical protein